MDLEEVTAVGFKENTMETNQQMSLLTIDGYKTFYWLSVTFIFVTCPKIKKHKIRPFLGCLSYTLDKSPVYLRTDKHNNHTLTPTGSLQET